jgi:glutamine synthetase
MNAARVARSGPCQRRVAEGVVVKRIEAIIKPFKLDEALTSLRRDYEFLLKGDVFTRDVIETWIDYKMEGEVNPIRLRPTPLEFGLYFDC